MNVLRARRLELGRERRRLARRVGGAGHSTARRTLFTLDLHADGPRGPLVGRGEASPLPGYSIDTAEETAAALAEVARALPWSIPLEAAVEAIAALTASLPPAARAGLETALLDAVGQALSRPLWSLLGDEAPAPLPLCAMLDAPPGELAAQSRLLAAAGAVALKRKLQPEDAPSVLEALRTRAPGQLRVDANRSLSPRQLEALRPRLEAAGAALIEEPVAGDLAAWLRDTPVRGGLRVAADESLAARDASSALAALRRYDGVGLAAVVVKPARDGLLGALALGRAARALGAEPIVTHLWDGVLGWQTALHLALALASPGGPAQGLWPHAGLGDDEGRVRAMLIGGRAAVPTEPGLGIA